MKRAKNNQDLAHQFATIGHDKEESLQGSNFFFTAGTIYSYGRHFPIAKYITFEGKKYLLVTSLDYSISTAKHINYFKSASRHIDKIYTYDIEKPFNNIALFKNTLESLRSRLATARKKHIYIEQIQNEVEKLNKYITYLESLKDKNLKTTIKELKRVYKEFSAIGGDFDTAQLAQKIKAERERQRREKLKKDKEAIKKFLNFETNYIGGLTFDVLRYNEKTQRVETTQRVEIPVEIARRLQNDLKAGQVKEGDKVMHYTVRAMNKKFISIGCHTFEIEYLINFKLPAV